MPFGIEQIQYTGNGATQRRINVQHIPFFVCINAYQYDTAMNYLGIFTQTTYTIFIQRYSNPNQPHTRARISDFSNGILVNSCQVEINNVEYTLNDKNVAYNGFCFYFT